MHKSLKDWAKDKNISYAKAYRQYKKGEIKDAFLEKGDIFVKGTGPSAQKTEINLVRSIASTDGRKNRAAEGTRPDEYKNIKNLFTPYYNESSGSNPNNSTVSARDMIILCQKAYYGVSSVRRVVDTFVDFCCADIYFEKGNAKSREFYTQYFKAIKLGSFQNKYYMEYIRSGNPFIYQINGVIDKKYLDSLKTYSEAALAPAKLPVAYVILNPADVVFNNSAFFSASSYSKKLNTYEVGRLRLRETDHEKQIFAGLPPDIQKKIMDKNTNEVYIPLNKDEVTLIFNSKQDYEAFAVSPIYPVLGDIEFKMQLKKMDEAIARTCQSAVLHVKHGYEDKAGNYHYNEAATRAIEEIFTNEELSRVFISDFTTDVEFIFPQIGELLDPKKYEIVNQDIHEGLMDVIFGGGGSGEKFSNLSIKIKVFVERIRKAREVFLTEFLIPQMEKIGKAMGFKAIPTPKFEDIDLEDNINFYRIVSRLGEVGILTPEEIFQAFENGRMPNAEESIESQKAFKELRDKGLYQPIAGAGNNTEAEGGRPGGTSAPQTTKQTSPIGTNASFLGQLEEEAKFKESAAQIVLSELKLKKMTPKVKELVDLVVSGIVLNETKDNWESSVAKYLKNDYKETQQTINIRSLAAKYNTSVNLASSLYHAGLS